MENWKISLIILSALFSSSVHSAAVAGYLNEKDLTALRNVFSGAASNPSDVAVAFYGAGGLKLLNLHEKIPENDVS